MALVLLGSVGAAAAHPLGNFTVNRYAEVEVSAGVVRVRYVLDLAEVPAFQARDEIEADPEAYEADQVDAIAEGLTLEVGGRPLDLRAADSRIVRPDGQGGLTTLRLSVLYEAQLPEGAPDEVLEGRFVDDGAARIGWREIIVTAAGDAQILESSVPAEDISDALRSYPEDRLRAPLDVREATFRFSQGSDVVAAGPLDAAGGLSAAGDRFTELLERQRLTPLVLVGMLGVAALVGVGHALAPGHGKTVMAAYLIGTRGRPVDAVLLGVIVSLMHTTSVLLLGLALYQLDERFALDRIYPVLTLVSGVGVLLVGAWLATTRYRTFRGTVSAAGGAHGPGHGDGPGLGDGHGDHGHADHGREHALAGHPGPERERTSAGIESTTGGGRQGEHGGGHDHGRGGGHAHDHDRDHAHGGDLDHGADHDGSDVDHDHDGHDHDLEEGVGGGHEHLDGSDEDHDHGHHHGPGGHSHELPEGVAPLSKRGVVILATAGGIVPSPSAVIVLVSAFTLGRVGLGLALVAAFSVGLAATLTTVGLALVLGSRALGDRGSARLVRVFPVLGAGALLVLGLVLTVQGFRGL